MKEGKRNNYRFWHSPLVLIILFCFLLIFGYKIIDLSKKNIETRNQKYFELDKLNNLKEKENSLLGGIAKLQTDEGVEEMIREKYMVARENEKMVTIVEEGNSSKQGEVENNKSHGFWSWIKRMLGK
jgi:cell division protein FtsB